MQKKETLPPVDVSPGRPFYRSFIFVFIEFPRFSYVEGFISSLDDFINKYHENGRTFFNETVTQSELTLTVSNLCSYSLRF
jgi:hypothetical protein